MSVCMAITTIEKNGRLPTFGVSQTKQAPRAVTITGGCWAERNQRDRKAFRDQEHFGPLQPKLAPYDPEASICRVKTWSNCCYPMLAGF